MSGWDACRGIVVDGVSCHHALVAELPDVKVITLSTQSPKTTNVPYAASVRAGDFIYTAGQVPRDANRQVIGSSIEEQTAAMFDKLRAALSAYGASLQHVVKMQVFLADISEWPRFNDEYVRQMGSLNPVRTTAGCNLNGVRVEIDAVAYLPPLPS